MANIAIVLTHVSAGSKQYIIETEFVHEKEWWRGVSNECVDGYDSCTEYNSGGKTA